MDFFFTEQQICSWLEVLKESVSNLWLEEEEEEKKKIKAVKPKCNHAPMTRKSKLRASSWRYPLSNRWIPTRALLILFICIDRLRGSAFCITWPNSTSISLDMPCMFYEIGPTGMQSFNFAYAPAVRERVWFVLLLFSPPPPSSLSPLYS